MRWIILLLVGTALAGSLHAATPDSLAGNTRLARLIAYEDSLLVLGDSMVRAQRYEDREAACIAFIPYLVQALKTEESFDYPFDRVQSLSIVEAPDGQFRLFTFQMRLWDYTYRYFGAIQYADKSLRLTPLIDGSLFMPDSILANGIFDADNWYGAIYYDIAQRKIKGTTYYFLCGFDGWDMFSSRKLVEVLHFEDEKPVFGAPRIEQPVTTLTDEEFERGKRPVVKIEAGMAINRFILEYKKEAATSLRYDPDLDMIVYDHLIPENPLSAGIRSTYIPDGSYEGFAWDKGMWRYVEKVFFQTQQAPPLFTPKAESSDPGNYERNRP